MLKLLFWKQSLLRLAVFFAAHVVQYSRSVCLALKGNAKPLEAALANMGPFLNMKQL